MAATAAPYGLIPCNRLGGVSAGAPTRAFPMVTNVAAAFYAGQLLKTGADGELDPAADGADAADSSLIGVLVGIDFVDPTLKYFMSDGYLPANAVTAGYTNIVLHVCDDPFQLYRIQADDTAALTARNFAYATVNNATGSAVTKRSNAALDIGTGAASAADVCLRLVDFVENTQSTRGDAYTDCIVQIIPACHMYMQAAGL